ncbi:MAG: cation-translocating P-type ATPase [Candidatus Bathyarchaeia archaeon]
MEQKQWHSMSINELSRDLGASNEGLTNQEAERRLVEFGPNELQAEKQVSPLQIFIGQFKSILIIILFFATIFSAVVGEIINAIIILAIVIASAGLGFFQEYRAERALEALKKMLSPAITVVRDGKEKRLDSSKLVPGDVIILEAGDKIPADARLFKIANLNVDESSLTGESIPVTKKLDSLSVDTYVADRKNMVYSGTTVTYGRARAFVTSTGMRTEFGKIAKEVTTTTKEKTPLEIRTESIGKWLGVLCLGACLVVVVFGILREYLITGLVSTEFLIGLVMFGIALAVAAVPEALPAIVTGTLAIGMNKMAKRNALVRRMPAVETLGSTTVICSDKTGTLTKGEMTVRQLYLNNQSIDVTGVGYEPKGHLKINEIKVDSHQKIFSLWGMASILCNDASLEKAREGGNWHIIGDPTEGALIVAGEKAGFRQDDIREKYPRVSELPFSSERKRMSTVHQSKEGKKLVFTKGAPETILERCSSIHENGTPQRLSLDKKRQIHEINEKMAAQALRVLAVAYKEIPDSTNDFDEKTLESDLIFLGLIGMIDPPRPEAKIAVKRAKQVGMKSIMITGDHKLTAVAIATEMGIYEDGNIAMTGDELERISDEELQNMVTIVTVYARVSPLQKLKIVKAWKKRGEVVAMTGDGVNDAPAVKNADIGIAMGITGTEVTKESSDMVLADDNFATIVQAIEEGRIIYDNIKQYLTYLLKSNIVELIVIGGGVLAGLPLPLLAAQILWVNLITDGPPALALGVSPPSPDVMLRPPRDPKESIFSSEVKSMLTLIPLVHSPILLYIFISSLNQGVNVARTSLFIMFIFFELVVALNCRSLKYSIFKVKPHKILSLAVIGSALSTVILFLIPQLRSAFELVMPTLTDIMWAAVLSILPIILIEMLKMRFRKSGKIQQNIQT